MCYHPFYAVDTGVSDYLEACAEFALDTTTSIVYYSCVIEKFCTASDESDGIVDHLTIEQ